MRKIGNLRNDKIYSGNTRLKKSRKVGQKRTSRGVTTGCLILLADGEGFPRTMLMHRLRGNRDDLTALHWSNLLVVEQGFSSAPPIHKIKNAPLGRVYFMADGEGFEPPVELPPQRFSRPSHSTALPPILNFLLSIPPVFQTCGFVRCSHRTVLLTTRSRSTSLRLSC